MNVPIPRGARALLAAASVVALFLPAAATLPDARVNLERSVRLWNERRVSPDIGSDLDFRALAPWLPPGGLVGFHNVSRLSGDRLRFRLQYALPPRRIVPTRRPEYVIEYGPADRPASLARNAGFVLVGAPHDELRVFRRIRP